MIRILFFAHLKEVFTNELNTEGVLNIAYSQGLNLNALRQLLMQKDKAYQEALMDKSVLVAVNQEMTVDNLLLKDGDEVAFFPPVTGG